MRYGTPDKIFFCLVKPKMNNNSVSCLRLLSHFSSLTSPCLHSTVSRLLSLVSCSCLMSPVSHLLFHASCLVSCLLSSHLPCCKLCRFKWQWFVRFYVLFARPRFGPYMYSTQYQISATHWPNQERIITMSKNTLLNKPNHLNKVLFLKKFDLMSPSMIYPPPPLPILIETNTQKFSHFLKWSFCLEKIIPVL